MTKDIINDVIEDQKIKIHRDHISWLKLLDFYEGEITFFEKELNNVVNASNDRLAIVEHVEEYQNILARKTTALEELREVIKFQQKIFTMDEILPDNIDYHLTLNEKFDKFVSAFEELKPAFKRFSSHSD